MHICFIKLWWSILWSLVPKSLDFMNKVEIAPLEIACFQHVITWWNCSWRGHRMEKTWARLKFWSSVNPKSHGSTHKCEQTCPAFLSHSCKASVSLMWSWTTSWYKLQMDPQWTLKDQYYPPVWVTQVSQHLRIFNGKPKWKVICSCSTKSNIPLIAEKQNTNTASRTPMWCQQGKQDSRLGKGRSEWCHQMIP